MTVCFIPGVVWDWMRDDDEDVVKNLQIPQAPQQFRWFWFETFKGTSKIFEINFKIIVFIVKLAGSITVKYKIVGEESMVCLPDPVNQSSIQDLCWSHHQFFSSVHLSTNLFIYPLMNSEFLSYQILLM